LERPHQFQGGNIKALLLKLAKLDDAECNADDYSYSAEDLGEI
jgi:hypothetical protein